MKILIEIPDYVYEHAKESTEDSRDEANAIKAIANGTQQRTGRWIDDEFGSKCSCCGIYTHLDKFDRPMKFKCCSMCGAKMEVI